jgi:nitrogen fixation protein FixH
MRRGGEAAPARRSRWIPWTIAGVFAAIVLADLVMVAIAVRSDPGLVAGSPARLGTGNVLPPATGLRLDVRTAGGAGGGAVVVEARLLDRDGRPVPAAAVSGAVQRATDARADAALAFTPAAGGDAPHWRAALPDLPAGAWDVALQARDEAGQVLATATLRLRR